MINFYPSDTLEKIEFDKVISLLSDLALSNPTKEVVKTNKFFTNDEALLKILEKTNELMSAIEAGHTPSLYPLEDIEEHIYLLNKDGYVLELEQYIHLYDIVKNYVEVRKGLKDKKVERNFTYSDFGNFTSSS